jgi:hypothetical protein
LKKKEQKNVLGNCRKESKTFRAFKLPKPKTFRAIAEKNPKHFEHSNYQNPKRFGQLLKRIQNILSIQINKTQNVSGNCRKESKTF